MALIFFLPCINKSLETKSHSRANTGKGKGQESAQGMWMQSPTYTQP